MITRFAPSPTGHLHIGGARTALFCWAFARRMGGKFLLRIEDTDVARSSEASARGILEDLAWLGIEWDEGPQYRQQATGNRQSGGTEKAIGGDPRGVGPFHQSQRLPIYNAVIDEMIEKRAAYADFTPAQRLDEMRKAANAAKATFRFHPPESEILPVAEQRKRMSAGEAHVIRLRSPQAPVRVMDQVLGEVSFGAGEVDDFVLRKADGFPTYHFGVVVDDQKMGVTHVLRGQEHLMNTPRHVALQRVLGWPTPVYAHMPLIFNDQGAKMSKRERDQTARAAVKKAGLKEPPVSAIDGATWSAWLGDTKRQLETGQLEDLAAALNLSLPEVSVDDFRRAGYLPEVICNFIALLGWNPGMKNADGRDVEKFGMEFLAQNFDLERIGKTNARFDRKKLASFNGDAIAAMGEDEFRQRLRAWCEAFVRRPLERLDEARFALFAHSVRPRCKTLSDAVRVGAFALAHDEEIVYDEAAVKQHIAGGAPSGADLLRELTPALKAVQSWTPETIGAAVEQFAGAKGVGMGPVAQALRVAVTGTGVSPGVGETLAILGKDSTLRRIDRCAASARA